MRLCSACGKEDQPWFEQHPCNCGAFKPHDDDPSPLKHRPDCKCLGHEVVLYPVRIPASDLAFDDKGQASLASAYYTQRGWKLKQNGGRYYRTKMLCRDCIGKEEEALGRKREYEKSCRAARGQDDKTYAQMLAQQ